MSRQSKQVHKCPECDGVLKRTIGAATRKKYWQCVSEKCGWRRPIAEAQGV